MTEFDLTIAGGGIASLAAAEHAARLGLRTVVLCGNAPGGLLLSIERIEGIPGFPDGTPGYDLCPGLQESAADAGAVFVAGQADALACTDGVWEARSGDGRYRSGAVIVATGARLRSLGVPGEVELQGKGVSHCASCDAPLLRDQVVVVVGSGDSAMQEALTLAEHAPRVVMLHRGEELSGQDYYRRKVLAHSRIEHRYRTVVTAVTGDGVVSAVEIDEGGSVGTIDAGAVFIYVGLQPNSTLVEGIARLDSDARIAVDSTLRTSARGMFAAGIVRSGSSGQALGAAGDGVTAAAAAARFLQSKQWN